LSHTLPSLLPGGRVLLYTVRKRQWSWGDEEVVALTLATGKRTQVLTDATDARYVPTGHLAFVRRGLLYAVPFDAERLQRLGLEAPVLDPVAQALTASSSSDVSGAGQFAVSATGALAWLSGPVVPYAQWRLVTVDRHGQVTPLPAPARSYGARPRLSPDQRRLAVTVQDLTEVGLWVFDLTRPAPLLRLPTEGEVMYQLWRLGGQQLIFRWLKDGRWALATQPADGTAPPQTLGVGRALLSSVAPDGRIAAVVAEVGDPSSRDIVTVMVENGKARLEPLIQTPGFDERWPVFSPDGRWLVYGSNVTKRFEIYVRPYPGPARAVPVSVEGGSDPAWHPNGREIFFVGPPDAGGHRRMMAVAFTPGSATIGKPEELFSFDPSDLRMVCEPVGCYDVAADGRFYTLQRVTPPPPPVVTHINLIQNWFEELKAKVPTGR
jgi:hypothetical protein